MKRIALVTGMVLLSIGSAGKTAGSAVDPRIALVIGNGAYEEAALANPVNDARLIAGTLRALGFEVMERLDLDQKAMKMAIFELGDRLEEAGKDAVGLFYYAGHGVQVNGENFLIPLNAKIEKERHVAVEAVSADWIFGQMEFVGNRMNVIILDACRNNPLTRRFRSSTRGLARMDAPRGSLIAYSTAPGDVALDGERANSPYSEALASALMEPGVPVERMFREVRNRVMSMTSGSQVPWESSSLTGEDFYFNPPEVVEMSASTQPAASAGQGDSDAATERLFWESIQDSTDPAMFEEYLTQYPNGAFAGLAKLKRDALRNESGSPTQSAAVVEPAAPTIETEEADAPRSGRSAKLARNIALAYMRAEGLGNGEPTESQIRAAANAITRAREALKALPEMPSYDRIPSVRLAAKKNKCLQETAKQGLGEIADDVCSCMIRNLQRYFSMGLFSRLDQGGFYSLDSMPSKARRVIKLSRIACLGGSIE